MLGWGPREAMAVTGTELALWADELIRMQEARRG